MRDMMKRRLSNLEQAIRPPLRPERFWALVEEDARLQGVGEEEAFQLRVRELSDEELQYLIEITEPTGSDGDSGSGYGTSAGCGRLSPRP